MEIGHWLVSGEIIVFRNKTFLIDENVAAMIEFLGSADNFSIKKAPGVFD
jgi:hypothetical protein